MSGFVSTGQHHVTPPFTLTHAIKTINSRSKYIKIMCSQWFDFFSKFSMISFLCYIVLVTQPCLIIWNPVDCIGSFVHGIHPARIQEWVTILFSRGSSQPKDQTWVSHITGRFFTIWATREVLLCYLPCLIPKFPCTNASNHQDKLIFQIGSDSQ